MNIDKNYLLSFLDSGTKSRLKSKLEPISFKLGKVIYEAGDNPEYAYFPTNAIISLLYVMEDKRTAEIGVIGNDGIVGVPIFLGGGSSSNRAIIQSAGDAYRIKAEDLVDEFRRAGRFQYMLLRYAQALMTQISQTAVCNRIHAVEQQLCRWLLLSHDRIDSDKLVMTHDLISNMLGVRREGITLAAKKLATRKLIHNTRGTMEILDREGLEEAVCECYQIVSLEYNRLLGRGISRTFN